MGEESFKLFQVRCRQSVRHTRHVVYIQSPFYLHFYFYFYFYFYIPWLWRCFVCRVGVITLHVFVCTDMLFADIILISLLLLVFCCSSLFIFLLFSSLLHSSLHLSLYSTPHYLTSSSPFLFLTSHTDWEPSNLLFLETACSLYHLLIEDENTKNLVFNDLKSTVFHDVSRELEHIFEASKGGSWSSSIARCAFRPSNCATTMMREYFILLGRISSSPAGKQILEGTLFYLYLYPYLCLCLCFCLKLICVSVHVCALFVIVRLFPA